jgi:hypothetical protein
MTNGNGTRDVDACPGMTVWAGPGMIRTENGCSEVNPNGLAKGWGRS